MARTFYEGVFALPAHWRQRRYHYRCRLISPQKARVSAIDTMPKDYSNDWIFVRALSDDYWEVRAAAAQALRKLGGQAYGPLLLEALLSETDFTVREALIRALGTCGEEQSVLVLTHILHDQDESWMIREAAAWSLGVDSGTLH